MPRMRDQTICYVVILPQEWRIGKLELKTFADILKKKFEMQDITQLPERLTEILFSDNRDFYMNLFLEITENDLKTDYLQKVYQFWMADREEKKQDYTPASLAKLLSALTGEVETVYDCCAGSGALTIQKWTDNPEAVFICEELDEQVIPLLLFNMAMRNMVGYVIRGDVLQNKQYEAWRLTSGPKYSNIEQVDPNVEIKTNVGISNPPYNLKWHHPPTIRFEERFMNCELPPESNANFAFVLQMLRTCEKAALILPNGVLNPGGKEKEIVRYLVNKDFIETVITLPDRMFESTSIPVCVLVMNKEKPHPGKVMMLDLREHCETEIRHQRGEGDSSHRGRVYYKEMAVLSDDNIREVLQTIQSGAEKAGYSACVNIDAIREQDFVLYPARYIEQEEEVMQHRLYQDIAADLRWVNAEKGIVKITMNETLARDMGYADLYEGIKKSNELVQALNKTLAVTGCDPIESPKCFALSKRKNEIRIENVSKESISSIFEIFLPMWRQHMFYLNTLENKYLAELRDALLPDLMSGKIEV
jgi:type I restriction-modification system DNA methylase subunit